MLIDVPGTDRGKMSSEKAFVFLSCEFVGIKGVGEKEEEVGTDGRGI